MLQGQGTIENPLISARAKLMDISLMDCIETKDQKIVMVIEQEDELFALAFELSDFKEIIESVMKGL